MNEFLERLKAFAATFDEGTVEFSSPSSGVRQINVIGFIAYDKIPTFQDCYVVFGPTKIAIMAKPIFDGKWHVSVVSIR